MKLSVSPTVRMTFGVLCITASLILLADLLGFAPNSEREAIAQRQRFVEMLSVQLSMTAERFNMKAMQGLLMAAARRNPDVVSAAIRRKDGVISAQYGEHEKHWDASGGGYTSTHMRLPIVGGGAAAVLEVSFSPSGAHTILGLPLGTMGALLIFVISAGSLVYGALIRRSLVYLDPGAVVPARVRSALDVVGNGILILDEKGRIVLANRIFSKEVDIPLNKLLGANPSSLPWKFNDKNSDETQALPWSDALKNGVGREAVMLSLEVGEDVERLFSVNSSPIRDDKNNCRGVMVSFGDVTELDAKNKQLHDAVLELEAAKKVVEEKNRALHFLATRDPLTGCYNRRAFSQMFTEAFAEASAQNTALSCIMADVDHFKSVNDNYGHAVGDEVIKMVAATLSKLVPEGCSVGRYGGEEFCIMLPGLGVFEAKKIAERCRAQIAKTECANIRVTSSFGVSGMLQGTRNFDELVNQADEALYSSKKTGRNRVTAWSKKAESKTT